MYISKLYVIIPFFLGTYLKEIDYFGQKYPNQTCFEFVIILFYRILDKFVYSLILRSMLRCFRINKLLVELFSLFVYFFSLFVY